MKMIHCLLALRGILKGDPMEESEEKYKDPEKKGKEDELEQDQTGPGPEEKQGYKGDVEKPDEHPVKEYKEFKKKTEERDNPEEADTEAEESGNRKG